MSPDQPNSNSSDARNPQAFATTHWSMVVRAGDVASPEGRAAMEQLCRAYWYPLYWFVRRRGLTQHDAEDLVQAFFQNLLERDAIARADASRGRFRTFLLASLQNFHSHWRASATRLKRGGGQQLVSLDVMHDGEARFQKEGLNESSPEKIYDQKWALNLLDLVIASLRREYVSAGKETLFDELRVVLWGGRSEISYAEIARRLESSEGAVKVAVHRLRQRFKETLRNQISHTVVDPADIEDEMRHLLAAVRM